MKKKLLILSGLVAITLLVWNYLGNYKICDFFGGRSISSCPFVLTATALNLVPIIPLFLFSLITYWMRDRVYRAWVRFAAVWIPLSMIAILFAPEYSRDWMFPVVKSNVAFFSSLIFTLISLGIVGWGVYASRRTNAMKV